MKKETVLTNPSATALTKFRDAVEDPKHDKKNPHFDSKYATLGACLKVVRPALTAAGLDLTQTIERESSETALTEGPKTRLASEDRYHLVTRIFHGEGETAVEVLKLEYPVRLTGKPQEIGSQLTYARRYSLTTICGIVGDDDDDGNLANQPVGETRSASKKTSTGNGKKTPPSPAQAMWRAITSEAKKLAERDLNDEQRKAVEALLRDTLREHGYESTKDIPVEEIPAIQGEIIGQLEPVLMDSVDEPDTEDLEL